MAEIPARLPFEERLRLWHGEIWHTARGRIIRDIVYAIDTGLVTTVSFLAGISISLVEKERVIAASLIQVASGTLAIFFGSYISTKAQKHFFENQIERERREIEEKPEKERQEIRQVMSEFGFTGEEQEMAVRRITADKECWLRFMVQEEIGISPGMIDNPVEIGFVSAFSFLVGALPALLPFFLLASVKTALAVSALTVFLFLFSLGVFKARITKIRWLYSGLETLFFGLLSSGSGFLMGRMINLYFLRN
ncbi:MAG TPA: VIT1/CCC1 transporter family protein [bacterium]|uniref:VIT family protein n=1 Tax=candidate division TA06 bacterium ADurb.Bin417 TaxID=1852828 RepID=A0A1V5MCV4_UNCT6|nr:MAG: VIT family protein [candidate division TA06 bacterium ADurb.Bin417]HNQ35072.1 VIT1/CCC1 transporter family protein [bacterium]HNS48400.1 VIT1/CCC1 transporter family protein [bacterium]